MANTGIIKTGEKRNPLGRPKGSLSQSTIFKQALKRISIDRKMKVSDVDLVIAYINEGLTGNSTILLDYMSRTFPIAKEQAAIQPIIVIPSTLQSKYNVVEQDSVIVTHDTLDK